MVWSSLAAAAVEDSSAAAKAEITPELCSHYAALEAPAPLAGSRLRVKGPPRLVTALRKVALGSMLPAAPAPPSIAGSPSLATRPILLPRAAGDAPQFTAHSHVFKQFLHAPKPDPVSTPDACSAAFVEQFSSNDSVAPLSTSPSTPSSVRTPTRCAMVRSSSLDALTPVSTADELVSSLLPGLPLPRPARLRSCTVKSVADTTVSLRLVPVTLSLLAAGAVEDSPAATEHEGDTADSNQRQARRVRPSALLAELGRLELVDARLALEANPIEPRLLRSYPASAPQAPPPSPPPSPPLVVRRSSLQQQPQLLCRVDPWSESPNKGSSSTSTTLAEAEKIPAARQQRVCHSSLPVITLSSIVERHYAAKKGHYLPPDTPLSFHRRQTSTVVGISRNINRRSFRLSEADLVVIAKDGSILVRQIPLAPELLFRGKQGWPHELRALLGSALTRWAEQAGVDTTGGDGGAPPSGAMAIFRTAAVVARIAVRLERRSKLEKEPGWHAPTWHTRAEGSGGSVDGSGWDGSQDSVDAKASERLIVPAEWRLLLAAHRRLWPAVEGKSRGRTSTTEYVGGKPVRFRASRPVRIFFAIFPWLVAAIALLFTQLYTLSILENHLEPLHVTNEWLLASAWSVVQDWLVEPVVIFMRNNLNMLARKHLPRSTQSCYFIWSKFSWWTFDTALNSP